MLDSSFHFMLSSRCHSLGLALTCLRSGPSALHTLGPISTTPTKCHISTTRGCPITHTVPHHTRVPHQHTLVRGFLSAWFSKGKEESPGIGPSARPLPKERSAYNLTWVDEYSWMEKGVDSQDVQAHLHAEHQHHHSFMAKSGVASLKMKIMEEMAARYSPEKESVPEEIGVYQYFSRPNETTEGGPSAYIRRPTSLPGVCKAGAGEGEGTTQQEEEVLLDAASVARDVQLIRQSTGMTLGEEVSSFKLSRAEDRVAYTVPLMRHGHDRFCCIIKDIRSGEILENGVIPNVSSMEFADDGGNTLIYTVPNKMGRPCKVMVQSVCGPNSGKVQLLLEESEEEFYMELSRTKDWTYLTINSNSKLSSQVHLLPATSPFSAPKCVQPRTDGVEYFVEHHHGSLYILTNAQSRGRGGSEVNSYGNGGSVIDSCDNGGSGMNAYGNGGSGTNETKLVGGYELMTVDTRLTSWGSESWRLIESCWGGEHGDRPIAITDMDMFNGRCVLYGRLSNGSPCASVLTLPKGKPPPLLAPPSPSPLSQPHIPCPAAPPLRLSITPVPLPSWTMALSPGMNQDFNARHLRFTASSPMHLPTEFDYDFSAGLLNVLSIQACPGVLLQDVCEDLPLESQATGQATGQAIGQTTGQATGINPPLDGTDLGSTILAPEGTVPGAGSGQGRLAGYVCRRVHATSDDGVLVPMTVLHTSRPSWQPAPGGAAKGGKLDSSDSGHEGQLLWRSSPLLLLAYGAYGQSSDPEFDSNLVSLLDRGFVVAYLHVRGGGELGRAWHEAGRQLHKQASTQDYLSCLKHLVEVESYSSPGLIVGYATSAGALLLGAALNSQPHMFGAAVLRVPFLDLLTAMTDSEMPLTVHEFGEWGDPADPLILKQMQTLCPYYNLGKKSWAVSTSTGGSTESGTSGVYLGGGHGGGDALGSDSAPPPPPPLSAAPPSPSAAAAALPPLLVSCGLADVRVPFWVPAKWAARARSHNLRIREGGHHGKPDLGGSGAVVLRIREGGHHGSTEEQFEELAEDYAFMIKALDRFL